MSTKLSVNINKVALIRNSRGGNLPNLRQVAIDCEEFGAEGITVHPRPDERHVRYSDLPILMEANTTEFNIEGYPSPKFLNHVLSVKPHQCTLVPDPPGVLTSSEGWDISRDKNLLLEVISALKAGGIRVSIFMEAQAGLMELAKEVNTDRVEFYTGGYAERFVDDPKLAVMPHIEAAKEAAKLGLGVNAGHDLNLKNLKYYVNEVPQVLEVSIGHALISDSLYYGLSNTILMYKRQLA